MGSHGIKGLIIRPELQRNCILICFKKTNDGVAFNNLGRATHKQKRNNTRASAPIRLLLHILYQLAEIGENSFKGYFQGVDVGS